MTSNKSKNCMLLLMLFTITYKATHTLASAADYDGPDDELTNIAGSSSNSDTVDSNQEFYDPAILQQEVETNEQRNSLDQMTLSNDDIEHSIELTTNVSATTKSTQESKQNLSDTLTDPILSEYDNFDDKLNAITPPTTTTIATTTMISDYVRMGKSKTSYDARELSEPNSSLSDYVDDISYNLSLEQQKDATTVLPTKSKEDQQDKQMPIAMKFYQRNPNVIDSKSLENEAAINKLDDPIATVQNSSEEEYYDEVLSHEHSGEDAPIAVTQNATQEEKPEFLTRGSFDIFKLPFGNARTTIAPGAQTIEDYTTVKQATSTTAGLLESIATTDGPPPAAAAATATTTASTAFLTTTTATTTTTTTTTVRPAGKQGKQINISRRKLLPHEQLHNYVEDAYIRTPLAVIIDPSAKALEKTKALWNAALRTNLNIKIILVSLNASGTPAAYNFNNTRQFLAGLNSIKIHDGGDSFIGVLHAAELVPYDSAVFISTATIPPHTELVQDAAITLLKKRIRLYLIWYGERLISENETQDAIGGILGEVAIRSGGEVLHIVGSENSQELEGSTLTLVADALRGSQEIEIPVDTTLASLHIKIDAPMRRAILETPNGDINLKKLVKFKSPLLKLYDDDKRLDAYVPLTKIRKSTVLKLHLVPDSLENEYTIFIRGERKPDLLLGDVVKRFEEYFVNGATSFPARYRNNPLPSNVLVSEARASGATHADLVFPETNQNEFDDNDNAAPKKEVETFSETEIHQNPIINRTMLRADADIITLRATNLLKQCTTKIEMGTQSQILVGPGMTGQLYFEMTNSRSQAVVYNIRVVDERSYLLRLQPQRIEIRPDETVTVMLTVIVPTDAAQGTIDRITFTAQSISSVGDIATLNVNLKVLNSLDVRDTTMPTLSWQFGSRCDNVAADSSNCMDRFWLLDIAAQDWQSGILGLRSSTSGLIYRNSYTVGSTEPLKATYIASCCDPRVSLTAFDAAGNQRTINIDVRDIVLNEATITAIVLGVILLIILLVLTVAAIVWCCRRRKATIDLPTYRSHSTRSME